MEQLELLLRKRSKEDERKVLVQLTEKGRHLQDQASFIPEQLLNQLLGEELDLQDLLKLKNDLDSVIRILSENTSRLKTDRNYTA